MHTLDYTIVAVYILVLVGKSILLARKAAKGSEAYFLAGRKMPWWALGASGMSSNLDVAGTMTIITFLYLYGLQGFFIEMRGGVVLPIAVFLAFMGKWHQRSNVVTTGEWMHLRFGHGPQAVLARFTAALTYVVITVGMVVFFLAAAGHFLAVFLPWDRTVCVILMAVVALAYTMISGLYGVIWTDVIQAGLIGFGAVYVAVTAAGYVTPELLAQWPGHRYNSALPLVSSGLQNPIDHTTRFAPFLLFVVFWAGKGLLEGLGGSGGSAYMAQRFYAAGDEPTTKKLCLLWTVLFSFRWPMVLGFAILAIHLGIGEQNPEQILPQVLLSDMFPVGIRGLLVTAIFAASMSTFDSTLNAGASYVVRDVFVPLTRGSASDRAQVLVGYIASAVMVGLGIVLALEVTDKVVDVWIAIVIQLFPAFLLPFALRWFWARFNGLGFTLGVFCGFGAAFGLTYLPAPAAMGIAPELGPLVQGGELTQVATLSAVGIVSLIGCLAGTFLAPATDPATLKRFYEQIRPFGRWPRAWREADRAEHRGDVVRLVLALVWQTTTFMLPMLAMLRMWEPFGVGLVAWLLIGAYLLRDARRPSERPA